ncbi:MAG: hypothetical protein IPM38_05210 [Ignavibacteria bacterium]|nr:hypothetical protein [Ignavibacteria bacterium]
MKIILISFCILILNGSSFSQQEPSQYLNEGIRSVESGDFSDAVNYLTSYLNSNPQNAVGNYYRAVAYFF